MKNLTTEEKDAFLRLLVKFLTEDEVPQLWVIEKVGDLVSTVSNGEWEDFLESDPQCAFELLHDIRSMIDCIRDTLNAYLGGQPAATVATEQPPDDGEEIPF